MTAPKDIGVLRQRVTIETQAPAAFDAAGARQSAPLHRRTYQAAVAFRRFSAASDDARRSQLEAITVTMRWQEDLSPDAAVIWRNQRYRIETIEQQGTEQLWLTLQCARDV